MKVGVEIGYINIEEDYIDNDCGLKIGDVFSDNDYEYDIDYDLNVDEFVDVFVDVVVDVVMDEQVDINIDEVDIFVDEIVDVIDYDNSVVVMTSRGDVEVE